MADTNTAPLPTLIIDWCDKTPACECGCQEQAHTLSWTCKCITCTTARKTLGRAFDGLATFHKDQ